MDSPSLADLAEEHAFPLGVARCPECFRQMPCREHAPKPYYSDDAVQIFHGDARDLVPRLPRVDIVLTDPPYNAGKNYGRNTDDRRKWEDWACWLDGIWAQCLDVSNDGILSFLSQVAYRQYVRLGAHEMAWSAVWVKPLSNAVCASIFMPHWEHIAYWGERRKTRPQDGQMVGWGNDVLTASVEIGRGRSLTGGHPTPKPLRLLRQLISQLDSEIILDPFMGSGTTLRAAKDLGRTAIGIEIEEKWCEVAAARMSQSVMPLETGAPDG